MNQNVIDSVSQNQLIPNVDSLVMVRDANINNQEWVNYIRNDGEEIIILNVKGIDAYHMKYVFQIYQNSQLSEEYSGSAKRKMRSVMSVPVRFQTEVTSYYFEDLESMSEEAWSTKPYIHSKRINLERDSSRYASFWFQKSGEIFYYTKLIRPKSSEPYDKYLMDIIGPLNEARRNLYSSKNASESKTKTNRAKYFELLAELHEALNFLDNIDSQYDFRTDQNLADLVAFYEMDSVVEIFKKFNIAFSTDSIQSSPILIQRSFDNTLALTYNLTQSGKIKNTSIEILPPSQNSHEENIKIGTISYYAKNRSFTDYEGFVLGIFHRYGGSTSTTKLTIWTAEKDMMKLQYDLGSISEDYGTPKIDTLVTLSNGKRLFLGHQWGGDGGDVWGSFWIREWTESNDLKILIEQKMGGGETYRNEITYSFLNDSAIELIKTAKYLQNEIYLDSLISKETLDLLEL